MHKDIKPEREANQSKTMTESKYEYKQERIDEVMHVYNHKSGLNVFVMPKKGYLKKYVAFAVHYGSIDNKFIDTDSQEIISMPEGIAHFLEHKLFDQEEGSIMDKFSELGSNPNAYTTFNRTVYYFSCTDKFTENLELLLDFVQNPYFTDETVEKEKEIIKQEISMYDDNPEWKSFFNYLKLLYAANPVREVIAGNFNSISQIDKSMLYKCYEMFYQPSNMVIFAIGDIDYEEIFKTVDSKIINKSPARKISKWRPEEPLNLNGEYTEEKMHISTPLFQMGFKDNGEGLAGEELLMREIAIKILLEIFFGRSSKLYKQLYDEGLVYNPFEFDYTAEENYAYSMIRGESADPLKVKDRILKTVEDYLNNGIKREDYERIRNSMYGKSVRWFNSMEKTLDMFITNYFRKTNIFDYFNIYDKITLEYTMNTMKSHFKRDMFAASVIKSI